MSGVALRESVPAEVSRLFSEFVKLVNALSIEALCIAMLTTEVAASTTLIIPKTIAILLAVRLRGSRRVSSLFPGSTGSAGISKSLTGRCWQFCEKKSRKKCMKCERNPSNAISHFRLASAPSSSCKKKMRSREADGNKSACKVRVRSNSDQLLGEMIIFSR